MSWRASEWALEQRAGKAGAKAVLQVLAVHADDRGVTFAGREKIAAEAEIEKATVSAHLKRLEQRRLIARRQRRREGGLRTTDWVVLAPAWADRGEMVDAEHGGDLPGGVVELACTDPDGPTGPQVGKANLTSGWDSPPETGPQVGFTGTSGWDYTDLRLDSHRSQVGISQRLNTSGNTSEKPSEEHERDLSENTSSSSDPHRPSTTNSSGEHTNTTGNSNTRSGTTPNPQLEAAALEVIRERDVTPTRELATTLRTRHGDTLPFTDAELLYTLTHTDQAVRADTGWALPTPTPEPPAPRPETPVHDPETLARAIAAAITPEQPR
ncbi:MAG TPA: hypothetical protein VNV44_11780 [Solirubrobacteraceae bacterium]|jgi:hypothetical protein|nr:hypothetical protein [Solirubrobacteraceae bacterium]